MDVGRTDLLGGWTVSSGGSSCQLFMSLTSWSGGYRATTRGCSAPALQGVSAWNLEGRQVTLVDQSGATVARLYPSSKTQFNGQTSGGAAVSFSR
ncbi:AprI/Inh family metalloprotease inhibitor [Faunimonas sp. B44]